MYYTFFREGCETLNLGYTISNAIVPGSFEEITFLSNKLSDNYHCIFQYFLEDMNGEIQITTTDMVGVVSGEINNYTSDFVKYPIPTFSKTPIYNEIGIEQNNLALNGSIWRDGIHQIGGGMYLNSLYPSVY